VEDLSFTRYLEFLGRDWDVVVVEGSRGSRVVVVVVVVVVVIKERKLAKRHLQRWGLNGNHIILHVGKS
jgi:hypothetical protein